MRLVLKGGVICMTILLIGSCNNAQKKKAKIAAAKQVAINKGLQEQLNEEFARYMEDTLPHDTAYYNAYNKTLALWNTPFHEVHIKTSHGNAHVIACGPKDTEPIVLLHGMDASSTMWYANIKALSQNHRVYAIDCLIEPGKSEMRGEVKDMKAVISWYGEILKGLKLEKFILIGASRGGWLATNIALQQKKKVSRMILLSPAQTLTWIRPGMDLMRNLGYTFSPKKVRTQKILETISVNAAQIEKSYVDQYLIGTRQNTNTRLILQMMPFSDDELKSLTMPVLVLIGDHDIINNKKSIERAQKLIPHCETGIIKRAGHTLSFDQAEKVNQCMLDFLEKGERKKSVALAQ